MVVRAFCGFVGGGGGWVKRKRRKATHPPRSALGEQTNRGPLGKSSAWAPV